jgi:23S rRNA (cytosine1962-C5)-methyltransferase
MLILFEDEHLLVANKPAGWNTHAPAPFAGEGLYDWLRHREPRWADLAIIHRLDKETSGVIAFAKTTTANRSLTGQFTGRTIEKKYLLLTDRTARKREFAVVSKLIRAGEKYRSTTSGGGGETAETLFRVVGVERGFPVIEARPVTGRTHQIRVHAAESGLPVLGDTLYGGTPAPRVCLHALELKLRHPATDEVMTFRAPVDFAADPRRGLRAAFIDPAGTNAFRLIHGAADGWPGWHVDQLGDFLLSQSESPLSPPQRERLTQLLESLRLRGAYHKTLTRHVRKTDTSEASPIAVLGENAPDEFIVTENGVRFALSFNEGYSIGLFLDQRDNRRRFLTGHVAARFPLFEPGTRAPEVLNTFAYTCGFSVCAARGGARVTSLDLSKKYLEWGRRNFALNGLDPAAHDFIYGDTFDWLKRFAKKGRLFDAVVLDPPTFSQSKAHGVFRVEKDFEALAAAAVAVLKPGGTLLAATNSATLKPENFVEMVHRAIQRSGRLVTSEHYAPQPPDFPITRDEPGHLKTLWVRVR